MDMNDSEQKKNNITTMDMDAQCKIYEMVDWSRKPAAA